MPAQATAGHHARTAPSLDAARVLIVDDDQGVRGFVTTVLTSHGHHIDAATGVDHALALLARESYEVAFVDLNMPGRSGLELLDAISATGYSVVPILLTGTTDVRAAVGGMMRGAFDYVAKPVSPDALRWALDRAVRHARSRDRERALESVVSEWEATFDACPDVLLILDAGGHVLRANGAAVRAAGPVQDRGAGGEVESFLPGGLGAAIRAEQRCAAGGRVRAATRQFDSALDAYFLVSVAPIRSSARTWVVVARDVTALVRGEEERKHLLRRVLSAQEDERGRIARELHDGVGQALVSLAVGLTGIDSLPDLEAARDRLARLQQVAAESLAEIRHLSHGLRPVVLDDMGLAAALARLTSVFSRVHGIRAELITPDGTTERLPKEIESALYRIAQEGLTNVAKHARARTVDVVLEVGDGFVRLSVADDGDGFHPSDRLGLLAGIGLSGMKERASLLGGSFHVASTPGDGTTLEVQIPITGGTP